MKVRNSLHVSCQTDVLGQALQVLSRVISTRSTLPILSNILLEANDQGLALTATNLESAIRKIVPADLGEEGSTTAPARLLADFVASLPSGERLEMDLDGQSQTLGLKCGRFDTHVKCIEAEEFPPSPRPDEGDRFTIGLDELTTAIDQTLIAVSTDEARPVLTGVLLRAEGGRLWMAATDTRRLAEKQLAEGGPKDLEAELVVPARALAEIGRAFKGETGPVEVTVSKARNQIFFKAGTSEVTTRLIDGKYPKYSQVIPSQSSTTVRVPTADLNQTVRAVSLFARDSANVVRIKAGSGGLALSASTNEVGDSKAELPAKVEGSEIQIAFNARYILDALSIMPADEVELQFDGPLSPGLLRPVGTDNYLYLIMPIRVSTT